MPAATAIHGSAVMNPICRSVLSADRCRMICGSQYSKPFAPAMRPNQQALAIHRRLFRSGDRLRVRSRAQLFRARSLLRSSAALRPTASGASRGRSGSSHSAAIASSNRRHAFDQQHPAPARPAHRVVDAHQPAGERASADGGNGNREHERRDGAGAISRRNPLRQVEHHARREAAFGDTEQQAQRVESSRAECDEGQAGGRNSPHPGAGEHPAPHADPLQQPEARPLDEDVADEEDADAEAVGLRGEPEFGIHLQRREADVRAIDRAEEQQREQRGEQPQLCFSDRRGCIGWTCVTMVLMRGGAAETAPLVPLISGSYDRGMDSRRLRYFVQIVDSGSITRAAAHQRRGATRVESAARDPGKRAEGEAARTVRFRRDHPPRRGASCTRARRRSCGSSMICARRCIGKSQPLSGTVIVGMPPTMLSRFGLPLIEKVCTQHPEMHLQIREEGSLLLARAADERQDRVVDLRDATRRCGDRRGDPQRGDRPDVSAVADIAGVARRWRDLARLPWVVPRRPNAIRTLIDAAFASNNLSVNVVVEIDSLHSAMETVRRGFGVGAMTMGAMKEDLEAGTLRARGRWATRRSCGPCTWRTVDRRGSRRRRNSSTRYCVISPRRRRWRKPDGFRM